MPPTFRDTLASIVQKHVQLAVAAATRDALDAYRSMLAHELGAGERGAPAPAGTRQLVAKANGKRRSGFGAKMSALLKGRSCPVPGCTNKSRGPRYRFFCVEHSESLSTEEKERIIAESKGKSGAAASAGESKPAKKKRRRKAAKA